jgi:hypothetical protein
VADLAGVPESEVQPSADHHAAAHAGPQRDAHEVGRAAPRAQPQLRQRQRADVVDERHGNAQRGADRAGDRAADPVPAQVRQQHAGAPLGIEVARQRQPGRHGLPERRGRGPAQRRDAREHRVRPVLGAGRAGVGGEHAEPVVDDRGLDVRAAEVEPQMEAHRAVHPPSTVSTVPVTNRAPAR